jgi:xylulokinase
MAIDRSWQPVTPFDSPLDTRSNAKKQRMMAAAGSRIVELAGAPPTYGQKILWWKEEHPEVWKRVYKFIQPAAYEAGLLAGATGGAGFYGTVVHGLVRPERFREPALVGGAVRALGRAPGRLAARGSSL